MHSERIPNEILNCFRNRTNLHDGAWSNHKEVARKRKNLCRERKKRTSAFFHEYLVFCLLTFCTKVHGTFASRLQAYDISEPEVLVFDLPAPTNKNGGRHSVREKKNIGASNGNVWLAASECKNRKVVNQINDSRNYLCRMRSVDFPDYGSASILHIHSRLPSPSEAAIASQSLTWLNQSVDGNRISAISINNTRTNTHRNRREQQQHSSHHHQSHRRSVWWHM